MVPEQFVEAVSQFFLGKSASSAEAAAAAAK